MKIILSPKSKTAQLLGEALNLPVTNHVFGEPKRVLRWGSNFPFDGKQINKLDAVERASNKIWCRRKLKSAGLPVPTETETDFPVIGRPYKHHSGHGFYICKNPNDVLRAKWKGATYFSKVYPKQNEYRVHVAGNKCLLVSIKEGNKKRMIWNKRKNNFKFRHMHRHEWLENPHLMNIVRASKKAVKELGLDFGAVDILADAGRGYPSFVICEVNTAPALSPLAISKYVKYFKKKMHID